MLNAIQGNAIPFGDRSRLVKDIISKIKKKWRTGWRNELAVVNKKNAGISYVPTNYSRQANEVKRPARFFHITIQNNHYYSSATNCMLLLMNLT
jgi:hypothetical protein